MPEVMLHQDLQAKNFLIATGIQHGDIDDDIASYQQSISRTIAAESIQLLVIYASRPMHHHTGLAQDIAQ